MNPATPTTCVELLQAMVAFDTVTPQASGRLEAERPLAEWLAEVAGPWGFDATWLPVAGLAPNLLLTHAADPELPWWLFDSHLDTVDIIGMTIDPFGGEVGGARLYGRGACDTKGSGAAMLWAAREAIAAGSIKNNIAILFTVGEEHAQVGARSFVEIDLPKLPWRPAGVVVGEPTLMQVVAASNGFVRFRVTTRGKAVHSSTPHLGRNAITDMARVVLAIQHEHIDRLAAEHPLTGRATCSINGIHGGVQHNIVPDTCEIEIDQRLTPGEEAEEALRSVRGVLDRLTTGDPAFRYELHDVEIAPPFAPESPATFAEQVAQRLSSGGIPSAVIGAPYTTNANHYAPAGLPCVVLGPGDIASAHTVDESISLEQLEAGVRGYRALMEA